MASVIIPAHNESDGIERILTSILAEGIEGLEVIVVANACRDDTAARARRFGKRVQVEEIAQAGKCNAINVGERFASSFPRAYVDADIEFAPGALPALLGALRGSTHLVSASINLDLAHATFPARLAYMVQRHNRFYFGDCAPNGSGNYVVSESGRSRWAEFPLVLNDDAFVGQQFERSETRVVPGAVATVRPPRTLLAMVPPRVRCRRGTHELKRMYSSERTAHAPSQALHLVRVVACRPWLWPGAVCYGSVRVLERLLARWSAWFSPGAEWNQDRTARAGRSS